MDTSERYNNVLTVITGTNIQRSNDIQQRIQLRNNTNKNRIISAPVNPSSSSTTTIISTNDYDEIEIETFRLCNEIQRILVDDFLPPISSTTAPGNPGRLLIQLSDVRNI